MQKDDQDYPDFNVPCLASGDPEELDPLSNDGRTRIRFMAKRLDLATPQGLLERSTPRSPWARAAMNSCSATRFDPTHAASAEARATVLNCLPLQ